MLIISKLLGLDKILTEIKLLRSYTMTTFAELKVKLDEAAATAAAEKIEVEAGFKRLEDIIAGLSVSQADLDALGVAIDALKTATGNIFTAAPVVTPPAV